MVAAAVQAVSTWNIDASHTVAEFAVKHMMVSTAKGRFSDVSGHISLDENDVTRSRVDVTIGAASVDTHDEKRDAHLRSGDFFDVENHPTLRFASKHIAKTGGDRLSITGDLTIRGVTREVVLDTEFNGQATNPWGATVIAYSATTQISRKDFGLTWNVGLEAGGVLVADTVKIAIDAQAIRA